MTPEIEALTKAFLDFDESVERSRPLTLGERAVVGDVSRGLSMILESDHHYFVTSFASESVRRLVDEFHAEVVE